MIKVDQQYFELIEEYRECFDEEIFSARYSDILDKYDYVVGLWLRSITLKRIL